MEMSRIEKFDQRVGVHRERGDSVLVATVKATRETCRERADKRKK